MPPQKKESSIPIDEVTNSWSNMLHDQVDTSKKLSMKISISLVTTDNSKFVVFVPGPFSSSEEFPAYKASIHYVKSINRTAGFLHYPQTFSSKSYASQYVLT